MRLHPFKLERFFAQHEFTAPLLLCASDCESFSIQEILDLEPDAARRFSAHRLGYTESEGSPSLREAISKLYTTIGPADVLVHGGAEEAIFTFVNSCLGPGDHVIVHSPCYQSLVEIARGVGCTITPWAGTAANGWAPDPMQLEDGITNRTRAIIVNTPHNPTGFVISPGVMQEVIEVSRRNGVILFSDEVYRGLEYDSTATPPAACDLYEDAVSLGVMSKTYGLAGLRIGWVATSNRRLREAMWTFKDYTTICSSGPAEFLAEVALRGGDRIIQRNREIIQANLELLRQFFAEHHDVVRWTEPRAGPIGYPTIVTGEPPEVFCQRVLSQTGVLLLPGSVYDDASREFRIGYGRRNMPEALSRVSGWLHQR